MANPALTGLRQVSLTGDFPAHEMIAHSSSLLLYSVDRGAEDNNGNNEGKLY